MNNVVVGSGLIAKHFKGFVSHSPTVIFASGVSNSSEVCDHQFKREEHLLKKYLLLYPHHTFVYFSSCALLLDNNSTPYFDHKRRMEELVLSSPSSLVLRVPQVVAPCNNNTLISNFVRSLYFSHPLSLQTKSTRRLIDISDILRLTTIVLNTLSLDDPLLLCLSPKYSCTPYEIVLFLSNLLDLPLPPIHHIDAGRHEPFVPALLPPFLLPNDSLCLPSYWKNCLTAHASGYLKLISA